MWCVITVVNLQVKSQLRLSITCLIPHPHFKYMFYVALLNPCIMKAHTCVSFIDLFIGHLYTDTSFIPDYHARRRLIFFCKIYGKNVIR